MNGKHLKVQHKRVEAYPTQEFSGEGAQYPTQDYAGDGTYHEYSGPYPTQQYQQGYESQGTATPPEHTNESSRQTPLLPPMNTSEANDDTKPAAEKPPEEESES